MSNKISADMLFCEQFPRSNKYDPAWIFKNQMGPNPLWLTEFLVQPFDLKPGMRVLDLGCGKGMTSVFLAREFGVQVYAVDFDQWEGWTSVDGRWNNAKENDVPHLIIPITAEEAARLLESLGKSRVFDKERRDQVEEKLQRFAADVNRFAKDVGERVHVMYKNAEPKIKKASHTVLEKAASALDELAKTIHESIEKATEEACCENAECPGGDECREN
jgi:SAM-dependent methyltransferase